MAINAEKIVIQTRKRGGEGIVDVMLNGRFVGIINEFRGDRVFYLNDLRQPPNIITSFDVPDYETLKRVLIDCLKAGWLLEEGEAIDAT